VEAQAVHTVTTTTILQSKLVCAGTGSLTSWRSRRFAPGRAVSELELTRNWPYLTAWHLPLAVSLRLPFMSENTQQLPAPTVDDLKVKLCYICLEEEHYHSALSLRLT
jgi:hypothetical protein